MESQDNNYESRTIKSGSWITADFIQEVLQVNYPGEVQLIEKILSPAVNEGDNYLSIMHRVRVRYLHNGKEKRISLIIKGFPENQFLQNILHHWSAFDKEILMYQEVLPKMKKLMEKNIQSDFIAPESFKSDRKNTVIMEDLQVLGYKMAPWESQLDYNHCLVALRTLARFHALSVEYQNRYPEQVAAIDQLGIFDVASLDLDSQVRFQNDVTTFGRKLIQFPETEKIGRCICDYAENAIAYQGKLLNHKDTEIIDVLIHGDLWLPNIMFKYNEEGQAVHAKLVDYQSYRLGSPAFDLLRFFFTSLQPEVLAEKMDDLLEEYYKSLCENFRLLQIDKRLFTLKDLKRDMSYKSGHCVYVFMVILPQALLTGEDFVPICENGVSISMTNIFRKNEIKAKYCTYLKQFEKLGYIETLHAFMASLKTD